MLDHVAFHTSPGKPPVATPFRFPRTYPDRDYWLCRCQGFAAYRNGRRVGKVNHLRFLSRHDRPDALIVRRRLSRAQVTVVSVEEVESIEPDRERIVLHDMPGIPVAPLDGTRWGVDP
jgi:hypothetical protein